MELCESFLVALQTGEETLEIIIVLQLKGDGFRHPGEAAGTRSRYEKY